jgi:hypothetical protein
VVNPDPLESWRGHEDELVKALERFCGTTEGIALVLRKTDFIPEANAADELARLIRGRIRTVKTGTPGTGRTES